MEPEYHVVLNLLGDDGSITFDSVIATYEGTRDGFKAAVAERNRHEADYLAHHGTHTDDGRRVATEIEMW